MNIQNKITVIMFPSILLMVTVQRKQDYANYIKELLVNLLNYTQHILLVLYVHMFFISNDRITITKFTHNFYKRTKLLMVLWANNYFFPTYYPKNVGPHLWF